MQNRFSGVVKISDINDFLPASQDCVVAGGSAGHVAKEEKKKVKIALQDCLACSGCVTSAEVALLENQSSDEFLRKVTNPNVKVVVSISRPALAALAVTFKMETVQVGTHFLSFFLIMF